MVSSYVTDRSNSFYLGQEPGKMSDGGGVLGGGVFGLKDDK
jgi:hypothetical protein